MYSFDTKASLNAHKTDAVFIPIGCTDRYKLDLIAVRSIWVKCDDSRQYAVVGKGDAGEGELRSDWRSLLWSEHRLLIHDEMIPQRVPVHRRPSGG